MAQFTRKPFQAEFVQYSGTVAEFQASLDTVFGGYCVVTLPGDDVTAYVVSPDKMLFPVNPTDWFGWDENQDRVVLSDSAVAGQYTPVA